MCIKSNRHVFLCIYLIKEQSHVLFLYVNKVHQQARWPGHRGPVFRHQHVGWFAIVFPTIYTSLGPKQLATHSSLCQADTLASKTQLRQLRRYWEIFRDWETLTQNLRTKSPRNLHLYINCFFTFTHKNLFQVFKKEVFCFLY